MLRLGLRNRLIRAWRAAQRRRRQKASAALFRTPAERLHVGSGPLVRAGWTNIDLQKHPGVDYVLDVRDGLPFRDVSCIYAEHFLEHLTYDEGVRFLRDCRQALRPDGVLRLSTPNLQWVWRTQYGPDATIAGCFAINKAFRGWGHQFLYDARTLEATLRRAGFAEVRQCAYGESADEVLRDLERHERYADDPSLPHVIIVEARGSGRLEEEDLETTLDDYDWAIRP